MQFDENKEKAARSALGARSPLKKGTKQKRAHAVRIVIERGGRERARGPLRHNPERIIVNRADALTLNSCKQQYEEGGAPKEASYTAMRSLAKAYAHAASSLQIKQTELMAGPRGTCDIRARRKESPAD